MNDTAKSRDVSDILIIIRWPVGGIRTFIDYTYGCLNPAKYRLFVLAPEGEEMQLLLHQLSAYEVSYLPVEQNPSAFSFFRSVFHAVVSKDYSLIHSQGLTAALCAVLPSLLTRTPHLATVHDVFNREQFKGLTGFLKRCGLFLATPLISKIHTVTFDAKDNLLEYVPSLNANREKIITIRHGIRTERFLQSGSRDFRRELDLPDDSFLIGFLGRFMAQKGFIYLVQALEFLIHSCLPPRRPYVLAFGYGGFIREEQAYIKCRGLEDQFYFMPFSEEVGAILRGLDVVAMPSLYEACGLLAMEAMVAGVPLIGTDCIGLREILRDTPAAVVPPRNSKAIADAISREMIKSSKRRSEAFRAQAAVRFDVKQRAQQFERIVRNLVK